MNPNPRPVRVDDQGRLHELDGTPIEIPGLEPGKVKRGIADEAEGRTRPLREIIAERAKPPVPPPHPPGMPPSA